MIRDLGELEDGATIDADIAVIGAGAAGITIARELIGSRRNVLLVESGGFEADAATQALYEGRIAGRPYFPLDVARLRFFGGSTNHWDGHCRPLDPIDFEKRAWVPHSGWPITRADLDPFYARAQAVCELGPYRYESGDWPPLAPRLLGFAPEKVVNRLWQFGPPTRFGEAYRDVLTDAQNVGILTHANAVDIQVNESGSAVRAVALKSLQGKMATLRPRVLVLACGGIENARLLLASDGVEKAGIGNRHDLVGRFFMEHPHALVAFAVRQMDLERFTPYYDTVREGTTVIRAKPGVSEAAQRRLLILNGCLDLGYGYDRSEGYLALRVLGKALADGRLPDDFGGAILDVVGDLDGMTAGLYRRVRNENVLWFAANCEQVPNPDSRVTLGDGRDALGMRKVRLDWRLSKLEKHSLATMCRLVGEELARLGAARMRIDPWLLSDDDSWRDIEGRYHHMGTTRMSDDPRQGVVNRDCRVHGLANLYIAGSSIFPTSGYANATLTIVALAIRLADHLKAQLRG